MHICFLTGEYPPFTHGGIGTFVKMLAESLVRMGHRVSVVGVYPREHCGRANINGVNVFRLPSNLTRVVRVFYNGHLIQRTLDEINREYPIDLVEAPEGGFSFARKKPSYVKLIRMHGGHHFFSVTLGSKPAPLRSWIEKRSFVRADALCAVSHYVADTTRDLLAIPLSESIHVLPNPVNVDSFAPNPTVAEEPGLIIFIGTIVEKKGVKELVDSMRFVSEMVPEARLKMIGPDRPDPNTGKSTLKILQERVPQHLKEVVSFEGRIEHSKLPDLLARAQVLVFPSHMEAMPIAWLEAMAMGKTVVASNTGPGPEIIEHNVTGLLCDPYNPESIAEQIIRALSDSNLRERIGKAARKKVEETYSLDIIVQKNIQFYEELIKNRKQQNV
jgi:glycosyltransferase involved in cell wall biosynthesis